MLFIILLIVCLWVYLGTDKENIEEEDTTPGGHHAEAVVGVKTQSEAFVVAGGGAAGGVRVTGIVTESVVREDRT